MVGLDLRSTGVVFTPRGVELPLPRGVAGARRMRRASSNGGLDGRTRRAAPAGARRDSSPPGRLTRGARRAVATSRRSGYRGRVSARHRAGLIAVAALALARALAPSTAATAATVT